MFIVEIKRFKEIKEVRKPNVKKVEPATLSHLTVYDEKTPKKTLFKCYVMENGGPSTDVRGQDKRILPGNYNLYKTPSSVCLPKIYKGHAISLYRKGEKDDYFKKRKIHIHIGNYPQDSEGCLLPAYKFDKTLNRTLESNPCVRDLYTLLYSLGLDNCILRMIEIGS